LLYQNTFSFYWKELEFLKIGGWMIKNNLLLFVGVLGLASASNVLGVEPIAPIRRLPRPPVAVRPDPPIHIPPILIFPCGKYRGDWIINANGYLFDLSIQNSLRTRELTGTMSGIDPAGGVTNIKGACSGNSIEFTRLETGQVYTGNLMDLGQKDLAGSFRVNSLQYGWFAIRK
jgi:hypothetical protein